MGTPKTASYGTWKSPITSEVIVADTIRLSEVMLDGDDVYWIEGRPSEGGRYVVVRRAPDGTVSDVTPEGFNARTRVHEYGGGAVLVADGTVWFSNFEDQRLHRQTPGDAPTIVTAPLDLRYADAVLDRRRNRIVCVREDHTEPGHEATNTIVAVDPETDREGGTVLVSGRDFYAAPRISPDGSQLAWLQWSHPNMPWDGTELWVADLDDEGAPGNARMVAGGVSESIVQPEWSPDGVLHFIGDASGWWNLYRLEGSGAAKPLCPRDCEFGGPMWVFKLSWYAFDANGHIVCLYHEGGRDRIGRLADGTLTEVPMPFTDLAYLQVGDGFAVINGGSPTEPRAIARVDLATGDVEVLKSASTMRLDERYLSVAEEITFPTENGLSAHAYFYAPRNDDFVAPTGERPPLLVLSHGGPTSAVSSALSPSIQYWTSRGFGVVDVNYGGSTGYGREYRQRLNGNWGIVDVDDCVNAAKHFVAQGRADDRRLAIAGGSAGGYTTLCALTFRDFFQAGASHFGLSDLTVFVHDTHKFESRYMDSLIGPWPAARELYVQRSAISDVDRLSCPVIFFQGDEDRIVPPNQAELMVEALRKKGIPVAYLLFKGEQHGFRKAENIRRALDGELYFYSKVFGFEPADELDPVWIENLEAGVGGT